MLADPGANLKKVFEDVKHEINRGALESKHPFRYVVFNTYSKSIATRYVVLRKIDHALNLLIYTDSRSRKVEQIKLDNQVQLLFYHPKKKCQVIVQGKATVHHQDEVSKKHWKNVQGQGKRAYAPTIAPGKTIQEPKEAFEWDYDVDDKYFTVISLAPFEIEMLQLNGSEHLRARFTQSEDDWNKQWIAP